MNDDASAHPNATYLYFDEVGNFDFTAKGTRVFVMTCVVMRRPFGHQNPLLRIKYDLLEGGLNLEYFHAAEDRQAVRDRVFGAIGAHLDEIEAHSVIIHKNRVESALREPHVIYRRAFEALVEDACPGAVRMSPGHIVAVTDHLPVHRNRAAFEKALKPYLKSQMPAGTTYDLFHHQSKADLNLQAADYISWAIYRKWNIDDGRSYELVRGCMCSERDVFADAGESDY